MPNKIVKEIEAIKDISIANYNSNNQVVVAGSSINVIQAFDQLKANGYKVVKLPVSAAFHTPLVGHAQKPFAKAIDAVKFNSPSIPVFSNATGKVHSNNAADIKKSLKNHILESVYFKDEIDNIYAAGGRFFIEFGPKNILTKLVENILGDKDDVTAIAVNANSKKSADLQMRLAALQMTVLGINLNNIDTHCAIKRPTEAPKVSPMMMKLSAASYVSPKTRKAFSDALTDGRTVKQAKPISTPVAAEPVIVEKIVEKIIYVTDPSVATTKMTNTHDNSMTSIERSVSQFVEHQQQLLDVHQQYMEGPSDYAKTVDVVLKNQESATELPQSIERTLNMYHQFQSETLKVHEQYLNNQTNSMSKIMDNVVEPVQMPTAIPATGVADPVVAPTPVSAVKVPSVATTVQAPVPIAAVSEEIITKTETTAPAAGIDLAKIQIIMMDVVADKTGYPSEMLELEMDMEADLGIDSIKRVEILGAVQELIPDLPELNPEDLAELRTLGEIVDYMKSKASVATVPAVSVDLAKIQTIMMDVVADKTGYPSEMLELEMDMEADLGIDSIKRVEILGAVQELIPDLPELNPEDLAELRTLGEIVDYMKSKASSVASTSAPVLAVVATSTMDLDKIQSIMMDVVADKTGYPSEMLELEMDMEADLGIDSIKRVEILGAVQELIPDLPELSPEDLAELRTLGEIVDYMTSKAAAIAEIPTPELSVVENSSVPVIDLDMIQKTMMEVVSEKTGYPAQMLELEMDMEADLGIDSIKRVEILGGVQELIPELPELNPEDLAELRTLDEIVTYMKLKATSLGEPGNSEATNSTTVASTDPRLEPTQNSVQPAPSAIVAIKYLASVNKIEQLTQGENLILVDDGTGSTQKLAANFVKLGYKVTVIRPSWVNSKNAFPKTVTVVDISSVEDKAIQAIISETGEVSAVVYIQPKTTIKGIEYPENSKQGLMLAFLLAKHCDVSKTTTATRSSFMVVTRQGSLGLAANELNTDLVQSGLNGLVKTLAHEWPEVFCRAVDVPSKFGMDKVASTVVDEFLDIDTALVEVAHDSNGRFTLVAESTNSYALTAGNSIDKDSVFLVSGGAKGVTAHCVIRLAKQYQSKFILLGRSVYEKSEPSWATGIIQQTELKKAAMQSMIDAGEKPTPTKITQVIKPIIANREITQTLDAITAAGAQVEYVSADVTDSKAVKSATQSVIALFGEVTGIIHGAGVLADKFIEQKTLTEFNAVYRTKIDGLLSLLACAKEDNIKHLVLFSSAAGFYGNPGQSDYSIANEILNKTAFRFKALHTKAQVLSFNWGPWDGGMVTDDLKRMFNQRGVYIIPLDAGADLMLNELAANSNRCPQILVGNDLSSDQVDSQSTSEGTPVKKLQQAV